MFTKENWFKEACEYTSVDPKVAIAVVEKKDPHARGEFFRKYQESVEYNKEMQVARSKDERSAWLDAWGKQFYNIFKMDLIKVIHEDNYMAKFLARTYASLSARLQKQDLAVLDFGCGSGYCCRHLLDVFPQAKISLSDPKGVVLDYAFWRCSKQSKNITKLEITDENPVPIAGRYDLIFCYTVLEHVWDPTEIVRKFHQSLNENGILIETYGGKTGAVVDPNGEDLQRAWDQRNAVLAFFNDRMIRLRGSDDQEEVRVWRKVDRELTPYEKARNYLVNNLWHVRRKSVRVKNAVLAKN